MLIDLSLATKATAVVFAFSGTGLALPSNIKHVRSSHKIGYVNVTAATLWTDSNKPRPVDAPALASPVELQKWLDTMTVAQSRDLTTNSRTQSQAVYGAPVYITDSKDGWYQVAVPSQPSPDNDLGYPGWVPSNQIATNDEIYHILQDNRPFVLANKAPRPGLYKDPFLKHKIMDMSYNTRLPLLVELGKAIQVAVPGGVAYVSSDTASIYKSNSDIPYPAGKDLVDAGKMFIGRPYLWGGTSGYAFDCSGFTHTLYAAHGITIARDAGPQAYYTGHGVSVDRANLEAGDLIFYASNLTDPKSIYHVAMYAGDGQMIESYASGVPLRLTDARFNEDYWGAERYLHK